MSDGNTTAEALAYLRPATDVYRVDLKSFTEPQYAPLGGRLATVLDAIGTARALGYWVEVVTLVVPDRGAERSPPDRRSHGVWRYNQNHQRAPRDSRREENL